MNLNYTTNWHFAIPIFSKQLPDFDKHQEALVNLFRENQLANPGINRSNENGWHSDNNIHHWDNDSIRWLNQQVGIFAYESLSEIQPDIQNSEIQLVSSWVNICGYGAWHSPHNHYPLPWSGVFYLSVNQSILPESKSGKIEFLNPFTLAQSFNQPNGVIYTPQDGLILLFPGALQHLVHPNLTHHERITTAFNLNIIPNAKPI